MTELRQAELPRVESEYALRLPGGGTLHAAAAPGGPVLVMGVLNLTPDSFSDGGRFADKQAAVAHAEEMIAEGADILDIGGESTRPGSAPVGVEEQTRRILPVIEALAVRVKAPISVDTRNAEVARRCLDAGCRIINNVSALRDDPDMAPLLAKRGAVVILMHMKGTPQTMQQNPQYDDVVAEVLRFLAERAAAAESAGIAADQIVIDPGFGFGKKLEHNMELLDRLGEFASLKRPILVGLSRKAMIGQILGVPPDERVFGTAALLAAAIERGAGIVRVHDVLPARQVAAMLRALHGRAAHDAPLARDNLCLH